MCVWKAWIISYFEEVMVITQDKCNLCRQFPSDVDNHPHEGGIRDKSLIQSLTGEACHTCQKFPYEEKFHPHVSFTEAAVEGMGGMKGGITSKKLLGTAHLPHRTRSHEIRRV